MGADQAALTPSIVEDLLEEVPFLHALSGDELSTLAGRVGTARWGPLTVVFEEGDPGDACYVIHRGHVKITRRLADGQRITLSQIGPGGVVGELALLGGDTRSASMETIDETTAVAIQADDLKEVLRRNADAAIVLARQIADRLRAANDRLFETATSTTTGRVLATLLSQVEARRSRGATGRDIELAGTPTDVARLAGTSKDEAARVMHWLENEGALTVRRGRIVVHSPELLRGHLS